MDFSRIPFNAALNRLNHLLPIGAFIRIQSVMPSYQKMSLENRDFYRIIVERSSTAFLSMTFQNYGSKKKSTIHFESLEAVLNFGSVMCERLQLYRTEGVPVEAILCKRELSLELATPEVLPFLAEFTRKVSFHWRSFEISQTYVTLQEVIAHLGPNVESLTMPWLDPNDPADITHLEAPQNRSFRLEYFEMPISTFEQLTKWLQKNAYAMAQNRFCKRVILRCRNLDRKCLGEEDLLLSALPYVSMNPKHDRDCAKLSIHIGCKSLFLTFMPLNLI